MAKNKCCLCKSNQLDNLNLGELNRTESKSAHYYCLLLATEIAQSGEDNAGILGFLASDIEEEVHRANHRTCKYCHKKGASVLCSFPSCDSAFHLPCGIRSGSSHEFHDQYLSRCATHRIKQKYHRPTEPSVCPICYDPVNFRNASQVLLAPCCKRNSFFHKGCLQRLALSAGYFFKCPICNDKKQFQKAMKHHGVFIPDRDASWELEPGAFEDLLYRPDTCNAVDCLCTKGRKFESPGRWEIMACHTCGSQGTHVQCSNLIKDEPWHCVDCIPHKSDEKSIGTVSVKIPHASENRLNNVPPLVNQGCSSSSNNSSATGRNINLRKRPAQTAGLNRPISNKSSSEIETIVIDSDSDCEIEVQDSYKCIPTRDGSILKVRNINVTGQPEVKKKIEPPPGMNILITNIRTLSSKIKETDVKTKKIPNNSKKTPQKIHINRNFTGYGEPGTSRNTRIQKPKNRNQMCQSNFSEVENNSHENPEINGNSSDTVMLIDDD